MAQTNTRKPLPHLSVPGQCPSLSRLEYVLGNKHKSFDPILPPAPAPAPPPSASLTPSALSSLSRPSPLRPQPELLPSPLIHRPSPPSRSMSSATPRTDSSQTTAPSVQQPRPRLLSPLPLRYPLTSQSSVYSYDDEDLEQEKSTPIPLHKRPVEEWSATAGVRLADQASTLRRGRELRKANRRLIKDVVSDLLYDQCETEDESEAHIIGTSIVTLVQHCFAEDIDTKPLSLLTLVPYVGRYIELLSSAEPPSWNPPHRRPHPPPSSRRLRSADQGPEGHGDDEHIGGISQPEGLASTSLGTTERTERSNTTSRGSSRTETRQLTSQLTEARQQLSDAEIKIQDMEDRCERLQMRVDGYWMDWAAREREVREGLYASVGEEIASSRASGSRFALKERTSSGRESTETGHHHHNTFEDHDPPASASSSSSSTSASASAHFQTQSSAYSPKVQSSVASYSSEGIIERLLTFPPPSQLPPTPQPPFASQCSTSTPAPSERLPSSSTPPDAVPVPVSPPPARQPSLPPSSTQLSWLSSSPTSASATLPPIQHASSHPPPLPPNPNPPSPPPSPSTLTFTPAHVRTSPRLLYPLKSCLKLTRPASPTPLPTQATTTTTNPKPNSSPTIDSSPPPSSSLKRRRNGLEPVYGFELTVIVKPEGYKLPGRLVKRVRG